MRRSDELLPDYTGGPALQILLPRDFQLVAQYFSHGNTHDLDQSNSSGGRFGVTKAVGRRRFLAGSVGLRFSSLRAWYRDETLDGPKEEKAESMLVELPFLIGLRGAKKSSGGWMWVSGHVYTGLKLVGGREKLWIGEPLVSETAMILGLQGPIVGLGGNFAIVYVNAEISPLLFLLPVVSTDISLGIVPIGLTVEFASSESKK